ncbi:MAG: RNA polymerase sigma factor, partial [Fibrella sp.]|nr:RNA polymerase sigma factor [Armatimonadota bacterium]
SLPRFRKDASFKTYALAICSNLCRDRLRSDKRRPESLYGLAPGEHVGDVFSDPAKCVERNEDRDRVRAVIASLSPVHREALHLRYVEDLPINDMARVVGCSRLAVPVRLFRARKAFEKAYNAHVNQEDGKLV